ncbi:putative lipoprotein [Roseibium sp. TrichSKD4]|uniref:hypothetical protein n=1 Tax=Roseibium sp. TrichSKD4 TaxID=744980 RepID=UPI0001E57775|nr:hypothetical protein [Roseibium sp. TrichSKD4]EFO28896.1 putative lipoprotein [Roseibium sp. TrichSKD4]
MPLRDFLAFSVLVLFTACEQQTEISNISATTETFKKLPSIMREFPTWRSTSVPVYDFEMRDGARRPSGTVRYFTDLSATDVSTRFYSQAEPLGCALDIQTEKSAEFICADDPARRLELHLENENGATGVIVLFVQTTPEFETVSF